MASPTARSPRVAMAPAYQRTQRVSRRPQHRFNLQTRPYELQPFMIAPVLPGESLKNLMLQSQLWSDPLNSELKNVGWWCEYYFFYVKHRDLTGFEASVDGLGHDLIDMFVSNEALTVHQSLTQRPETYCAVGGIDYLNKAVKRITEEYFRDEGEAWDKSTASVSGLPQVKIFGRGQSDWSEKLTLDADYEDRRQDLDMDGDGTIYANEVDLAFQEWAAMRDAGLMDMDYEDWMRTYGSNPVIGEPDRVDHHIPELIGHVREFAYPNNTVEPSTGVPAVSVGWRVAKRMNRPIRFMEPGWVVGLNVVRPKVYLGKQTGNIAGFMQTRESWLPAVLNDQMDVSHLQFAATEGPVPDMGGTGTEVAYWIDLRDLLNYGDQFVNWDISASPPGVALPATDGGRRYPDEASIDALFATASTGRFRQDGLASLSILGRQKPQTNNLVLGQG